MEAWPPGAHGTTFGGNPVCCAAAIATLEVLQEEHLVENAAEVGGYLQEELRRSTASDPGVADVRGRGLMLGIELRTADGTPDRQRALTVRQGCLERGVLLLSCGHAGHVLRLTPPLVLTRAQAEQALAALCEALRETLP
jgi:4-aminobutyrate aminotransferase